MQIIRGIGAGVAAIIGLILIGLAVFWTGYALEWWLAEPKGRLEARKEIQSGDFRIAAYDHFFNLCSAVQADEGRISALSEELALVEPGSRRETQVQASLTAVRSSRIEKIQRYNADAARDYTVGQFRDSDLPYRLNPNQENTSCAV